MMATTHALWGMAVGLAVATVAAVAQVVPDRLVPRRFDDVGER